MRATSRFVVFVVAVLQLNVILLQVFAQDTTPTLRRRQGPAVPQKSESERIEEAKQAYATGDRAYHAGNYADGIKKYKAAYLAHPELKYYNALAWANATCPDEKLRSSLIAVSAADHACEETGYKDPLYLDTYAAAFAQMGDFDNAVKWQQKVVDAAPGSKTFPKAELAPCRLRLELYKQQIPYREVPHSAILAEYKKIVGARLSGASLRILSEDEKSKLIEYLLTVPELRYMGADAETIKRYYDVVLLMLVSESMDLQERKEWTERLPNMGQPKLKSSETLWSTSAKS